MNKRIEWIDIVKGILMLTVILGHALQAVLQARGLTFDDNTLRNVIYSFHMPAFMAMSGYVVYRPTSLNGTRILPLLQRRFKQLIIPFLIWSVPLYLVSTNVNSIGEYIIYPNKGYWFLWALFFIIVIFNAVKTLSFKLNVSHGLCLLLTAITLIIIQLILPNAKILGYEYIAYYFIFYLIGYYSHMYKDAFPTNKFIIWSIFILWGFMAYYWTPNGIPFFLVEMSFLPHKFLQLSYRIATPIVFIVWMYSFMPNIKIRSKYISEKLKDIGQISLGLYLVHMVIYRRLAFVLSTVLHNFSITGVVIIEFILLIIISVTIVRLIKKNSSLSKWLLGMQ